MANKTALLIGETKLLSTNVKVDCYSCRVCENIFHAFKELKGKEVACPNCKEVIVLK